MKRFPLLLLLFFTLMHPPVAQADFTKTKIAVLDFQLQGEPFHNKDMGTIVAEWFITAMVREGRFDVVERRMLQKVLTEQKLAMSGVVDANSATQIGKLLGVKVIITGSLMKLKNVTEINARIIDVESASIIAAENVRSVAGANLQNLVVTMSRKIMKNFPLEGYVVSRKGDSVTLDLGILTGVKPGMQFIVFREGQVIKHPKTGEVLDVERIKTGTITITNVMQKICKAQINEESGPAAITYGQMVKSLVDTTIQQSRLTITTDPVGALIRVLNISPPYQNGIVLEPGPYHIEVSASGYTTLRRWINLGPNEDKKVAFQLQSIAVPASIPARPSVISSSTAVKPASRELTSQQKRFLGMLRSKSDQQKRSAAKYIIRERISDQMILDETEKQLAAGYMTKGSDKMHIDAMSWLCKALGSSGKPKYRKILRSVSENGSHRKLRKYAAKSLQQL